MNEDDTKWVEDNINDPLAVEGDFEGQIIFSTDGKNSVIASAMKTSEDRKKGLQWANAVYRRLLVTYGTKQAQSIKEYKGSSFDKTPAVGHSVTSGDTPQTSSKMCSLHNVAFEEKNGKFGKFYSHYVGVSQHFPKGYCNGEKK